MHEKRKKMFEPYGDIIGVEGEYSKFAGQPHKDKDYCERVRKAINETRYSFDKSLKFQARREDIRRILTERAEVYNLCPTKLILIVLGVDGEAVPNSWE